MLLYLEQRLDYSAWVPSGFGTGDCIIVSDSLLEVCDYKHGKQWVTSGYKPGDIVMFDFSGKKSKTEHVGILESITKDGNIITIEGNTGATNDANGGSVMRRTRDPKYVTGACRPGYNK